MGDKPLSRDCRRVPHLRSRVGAVLPALAVVVALAVPPLSISAPAGPDANPATTDASSTPAKREGRRTERTERNRARSADPGGTRSGGLQTDAAVAARLRSELGSEFEFKQTEHFTIAYDTSAEFAEFHGDLFEAVYAAFFDFFTKSGFPLRAPSHPLEAVLFNDRESFARYAARRDPALSGSGGFYSTAENRVAFFDSFGGSEYRHLSDSVRQAEQRIRAVRADVEAMTEGTVTLTFSDGRSNSYTKDGALVALAREERRIRGQRRELRSFFKDRNLTTTIHECVHQLAFNSGVQDPRADNPKWLGEGLATYFETVGYRDAGPAGNRNPERLRAYRTALERGQMVPLARLVRDDAVFSIDDAHAAAAYGQSWALVQYLFAERPEAFFRYLRAVARGQNGVGYVSRPDRLEAFQQAFGQDLAAFEADWHAYMRGFE